MGSFGDLLAEMRGSVAFIGLWMDDSISARSLLPFQKLNYISANQSDNQTRPNLSDSELQRIGFPFPRQTWAEAPGLNSPARGDTSV